MLYERAMQTFGGGGVGRCWNVGTTWKSQISSPKEREKENHNAGLFSLEALLRSCVALLQEKSHRDTRNNFPIWFLRQCVEEAFSPMMCFSASQTFLFHSPLPLFNYRKRKHVPFAITGLKKTKQKKKTAGLQLSDERNPFGTFFFCGFSAHSILSPLLKFLLCEFYHH